MKATHTQYHTLCASVVCLNKSRYSELVIITEYYLSLMVAADSDAGFREHDRTFSFRNFRHSGWV